MTGILQRKAKETDSKCIESVFILLSEFICFDFKKCSVQEAIGSSYAWLQKEGLSR